MYYARSWCPQCGFKNSEVAVDYQSLKDLKNILTKYGVIANPNLTPAEREVISEVFDKIRIEKKTEDKVEKKNNIEQHEVVDLWSGG